jgi:hypothetical protein
MEATRTGKLGGTASAGAGAGTRTMHLSSTVAPKIAAAAKTRVEGGTVVAVPFKTSATPFVRHASAGETFGLHSRILNPPNATRHSSHAKATHSLTAVTVQSAGTLKKTPVPYRPDAPRNTVNKPFERLPPPFQSTLGFAFERKGAAKPLRPYATIAGETLGPSKIPMHERLGFTNAAVTTDIAKRLHKKVYS